jgi:hypothetical protein
LSIKSTSGKPIRTKGAHFDLRRYVMKKAIMVAAVAVGVAALVGWDWGTPGAREGELQEWARAMPVAVPVEKAKAVEVEKPVEVKAVPVVVAPSVEAKEKAKEKAPRAVPVEPQIAAWAELGGLADQLDSALITRGRKVLKGHGFKSSQVRELILQACQRPEELPTKTLLAKIKYLIYQDKEFRRVCSCRMARGSCWGVLN